MFHSTKLKLTAWYLLIIMCISMLFSVIIYVNVNSDLVRLEERQLRAFAKQKAIMDLAEQLEEQGVVVPSLPVQNTQANLEEISEARTRLIFVLILINLGILGVSGIAGYFLAGRTLRPISEMVSEQQRFIADASHELRTPLTSLRSEMEVNLKDKKLSLQEARKVIASNLEDVIKLQALSDKLLELAQFEKMPKRSGFEKIDLAEVISHSIKKVSGIAKRKKILLQPEVTTFMIEGNSDRLSELFAILLDNAIKYSPTNSVVSIVTKRTDHRVAVHVTDQGVGIDKKDIPYIFDRFYRSDKSRTKNTVEGYGLGLSIAEKIVRQHKGGIKVKSIVSKGTTFVVELPMAKA